MANKKEEGLKDFLVSTRKKIAPGVTNAPVWAMQKKGDRIWNARAHRHWRDTSLGSLYRKRKKKE